MPRHDQTAIQEFDHVTLAQAEERLHTGRWSQAAYEAYDHLWRTHRGLPTPEPFPDTRRILDAHQQARAA